jgi:ACS family glucarate transporter-like MFS transporter
LPRDGRQWSFVLVLSCFSLVGYALRMNISIAAVQMMPELHLTTAQVGQLFSGFLIGYTIFQIPWGIFGDRFGARSVLFIAALSWALASLLSGYLPGLVFRSSSAAFVSLYLARLLLGAGEAAGFPVAARAIASRMPSRRHALGYGAVIAGTAAGSALTPPIIARLITKSGWRASFYWSGAAAIALALIWLLVTGRDSAPGPLTRASLEPAGEDASSIRINAAPWWKLFTIPSVSLICASYFLESYVLYVFVFWSYLYLVQQRHFTLLQGGIYTGLPFLVAMVAVPIVGLVSDWLTERRGYVMGRRVPAICCMAVSGAFLAAAVMLPNALAAIGALSLSVASLLSVETVFWSSSMEIGQEYAGTCGAIMNTAGNLGGIVSTAAVPFLLARFGWPIAFGSASLLMLCSAIIWLKINPRGSSRTLPTKLSGEA